MRIIRMTMEDGRESPALRNLRQGTNRASILLEMDDENVSAIPGLEEKLETALPGILGGDDGRVAHLCGQTGNSQHGFREELRQGISTPHLLEHVIIYLLGRSMGYCGGFTGQRSEDLGAGLANHYYIVFEYPGRLEAVIAVDLAFRLVSAWLQDRTVSLDRKALLTSLNRRASGLIPGSTTESDISPSG